MTEVLRVLLVLLVLLVSVERSECVSCYMTVDMATGQCVHHLANVDKDDCCQNPGYAYQEGGGACQACGPPMWSPWSTWSQCNVPCGDGVRQSRRKCFGINQSECSNAEDTLKTEQCSGTCCNVEWGLWSSWSSCSVSCGGTGTRTRDRVCSGSPRCRSACSGAAQETETCESPNACPVHGGWTTWLSWTPCSHSCIDDQRSDVIVPHRERHRSCSDPAPSSDTVPPGNGCLGDGIQRQSCSELANCPVHGSWGAWSAYMPCSVPCGEGLQLAIRACVSPAPKYGGRYCEGPSTRSAVCQSPCPVDGVWSGWSPWGECSSSCIPEGQVPVKTRQRSCSNPAPSSTPPGRGCQGENSQPKDCNHLSNCPVDGGWGSWSPFSSCTVTCGFGFERSFRTCDTPAPKHGGRPCPGDKRQIRTCFTKVHCPVDGVWSQWSLWSQCESPFDQTLNCSQEGGYQTQERRCRHQAHGGAICKGSNQLKTRVCYDVHNCALKGSWDTWQQWSCCQPPCGGPSRRSRRRPCKPDYRGYSPTIGKENEEATFFGTPQTDCGPEPDGGVLQEEPCVNVPACT